MSATFWIDWLVRVVAILSFIFYLKERRERKHQKERMLGLPQKCPQMSPSSSFIGGKRVEPRGEAWRLSQRSLVDESSL
jgi:hypothetical protein